MSSAGPAEPPSTGGCLCPTGAEQLLEQTDHVFIGDLVEVKGEGDEIGTAVIRVRENFKGDLNGVVEVRDAAATRCSWAVFEMATPAATSSSRMSTKVNWSRRRSARRRSR